MPIPDWSEELETGMPELDREHLQVAHLLGEIAMNLGTHPERLPELVETMIGRLQDHFHHEEDLMQASRFFAYPLHRAEHLRVLEELAGNLALVAEGRLETPRHYFLEVLPLWFVEHLQTIDKVTAQCLQEPRPNSSGGS